MKDHNNRDQAFTTCQAPFKTLSFNLPFQLILTRTLTGRNCYCLYFTDEESPESFSNLIVQVRAYYVAVPDPNPGSQAPEPQFQAAPVQLDAGKLSVLALPGWEMMGVLHTEDPAISIAPSQYAQCWCLCCRPQTGHRVPRKGKQEGGELFQVGGSVTQRSCPTYGGPSRPACSVTIEDALLLVLPSSSSVPPSAAYQPQHQRATHCGYILWSLRF